ncbi:MAG: amidohydrolase family protein [Planctomycetota bacterium]|jgi:imidazolonepropionase-like amidohydrolase|nr:hypothetical protein [Planctomycetota bacterium]MDP6518916.1 amidohydrolase family protein [Planctomycetota bacterium]MDP6838530.1 amidohydrolase family protein [Planctomycetota bacterium]MDP6954926.1 amidohydrolase family protein [Planctomycetota bacterium]
MCASPAWAAGADLCDPGELGGPGIALRATKVLTAAGDDGVTEAIIDHGLVLVRDGRIEAVGAADELPIPAGYEVKDLGERWLMPGLVELHSHVAGTGYNDAVYQTNPGLRASATVIPDRLYLQRATAGGVTTLLFIPGSATNMGGQGVLLKPGLDTFDEMLVRAPGSVKIAQGDNPKRWGYGMQRSLMAWNLRQELRAGLAYARRWADHERGAADQPERVVRYDVFRDLLSGHTQVSTHTQYYKLVLTTIEMLRVEFGLDVYIDHGSFDSYKTAKLAADNRVAAILGPREIMWPSPTRYRTDGRVEGSAWGFQRGGQEEIGFNTDAPVVPQEELSVQSAMGVRYGLDNSAAAAVRGLTIVPARTAGIDDSVGSLESGKDADILVLTGDPSDPRTAIEMVYVEGRLVYNAEEGGRLW